MADNGTADNGTAQRDLRLSAAIAVIAVAVLVAGVVTVVVRPGHGSGSAAARPPAAVTPAAGAAAEAATAYYAAVRNDDARTAYGLLCLREQNGYAAYAAEVSDNKRTGTGVKTYQGLGDGRVQGVEAAVPATVGLDDGVTTPILVLLVHESGGWRVCSSNLGGILPPPGPIATQRPAPAGSSSPPGVAT